MNRAGESATREYIAPGMQTEHALFAGGEINKYLIRKKSVAPRALPSSRKLFAGLYEEGE